MDVVLQDAGFASIPHLAMFCDEKLRTLSTFKIWAQRDSFQQESLCARDSQVTGAGIDFVLHVSKWTCFDELTAAYHKKGCRLRSLAGALGTGTIEWSSYGHDELKGNVGGSIILKNRALGKSATLPADFVSDFQVSGMRIAMNWSVTEASIDMEKGSIKRAPFLPTLTRSL